MKTIISGTLLFGTVIAVVLITVGMPIWSQQGKWASETAPAAKYMIDLERKWAEAGCTHQLAGDTFADDFQGTAPDGSRYDKAQALQTDSSVTERECHLDDAKVRLFGDNTAIVYGSERAMLKPQGQTESMRCLVWTDTWLKRNEKWQIVAAQDTAVPCK
ncbi:MAG TPA: nuclear transport factor 2 family protein [Pyrinomonadaceae bacterium]|nr:nuclear transport factor 2 family protein [Pyrinomonadaceae bacterium]